MEDKIGIHIEGIIVKQSDNFKVDYNEFKEGFNQFLKEKGWHFEGASKQVDWYA